MKLLCCVDCSCNFKLKCEDWTLKMSACQESFFIQLPTFFIWKFFFSRDLFNLLTVKRSESTLRERLTIRQFKMTSRHLWLQIWPAASTACCFIATVAISVVPCLEISAGSSSFPHQRQRSQKQSPSRHLQQRHRRASDFLRSSFPFIIPDT